MAAQFCKAGSRYCAFDGTMFPACQNRGRPVFAKVQVGNKDNRHVVALIGQSLEYSYTNLIAALLKACLKHREPCFRFNSLF
jgi:hypothetical protein